MRSEDVGKRQQTRATRICIYAEAPNADHMEIHVKCWKLTVHDTISEESKDENERMKAPIMGHTLQSARQTASTRLAELFKLKL